MPRWHGLISCLVPLLLLTTLLRWAILLCLDHVRSACLLLVKWSWWRVPLMLMLILLFLEPLSLHLPWIVVGDVEVRWHDGSETLLNYIADGTLKGKGHLLHFICNGPLQNF